MYYLSYFRKVKIYKRITRRGEWSEESKTSTMNKNKIIEEDKQKIKEMRELKKTKKKVEQ